MKWSSRSRDEGSAAHSGRKRKSAALASAAGFPHPGRILTRDLVVRLQDVSDAPALYDSRLRNRAWLEYFNPELPNPFDLRVVEEDIRQGQKMAGMGLRYSFATFARAEPRLLVGTVSLFRIEYGVRWAANIGYWVEQRFARRGFATQGVAAALSFAFGRLNLHRVIAEVHAENYASRGLIEQLGFVHEGSVRQSLYIRGRWRDHEQYSMLDREFEAQKAMMQARLDVVLP